MLYRSKKSLPINNLQREIHKERLFPYLVGYPFSSILIHIVSCRIEGSLDYLSLRKPTNLKQRKKEKKWKTSTLLVYCTRNFLNLMYLNNQELTNSWTAINTEIQMNHTQKSLTYRPNWPNSNIRDVFSSLPYLLHPLSPQPLSHSALPCFSVPPVLGHLPDSHSTRGSSSGTLMVNIWNSQWWFSNCGPWTCSITTA